MGKLAMVVIEGTIEVDGKVIEVGAPGWFEFVGDVTTRSFRFDDGTDSFTCRKERVKGTDGYWYGYRKVSGKLHKRYIGKSQDLTQARLIEVGGLLNTPSEAREKLPKPLGNSEGLNELGEARGTIRALQKATIAREVDFNRCIEQKLRLQEEIKELHNLLSSLQRENEEFERLKSQLSRSGFELPKATTLLKQLKARRRKSMATLADVETILELLPKTLVQQAQSLPDLYAAKDKLFEMPSMGGWKLEKGEKRERFYLFAEALIEEISKLDPNYTIIQRLQSELKQERKNIETHLDERLKGNEKQQNLEQKSGLKSQQNLRKKLDL